MGSTTGFYVTLPGYAHINGSDSEGARRELGSYGFCCVTPLGEKSLAKTIHSPANSIE